MEVISLTYSLSRRNLKHKPNNVFCINLSGAVTIQMANKKIKQNKRRQTKWSRQKDSLAGRKETKSIINPPNINSNNKIIIDK